MGNETPAHLVERNAQIVALRARGATYKELAREFNISSGRVSQILDRAGVQIRRHQRTRKPPAPAGTLEAS